MKKFLLLLVPFILMARMYSPDDVCKDVKLVVKEAKMINKKFQDPNNALVLLNASAFRNITYRKPKCMSEKEYLSYLDTYAYLDSKTTKQNYGSMIEQFIKKYPKHLYFYKTAGASYESQFDQYKNSKQREKALELYKKYLKLAKEQGVKADKRIAAYVKSGGLKKAKSTWGKHLNPTGKAPIGKFKAFYIDTHNPKKVVATEIVKDISVNYPYNKFHGIDSASFGAYWVGKFRFNKDTKKMIYISQSNSTTRVIIDGYVVSDGRQRGGVAYNFKKGEHKIEVEFINRWHTTTLSVKIMNEVTRLSKDDIVKELEKVISQNTIFNYVGVYESDKKNNSVTLRVQKSKKPIVLLLQSQRAVVWKIDNSSGVKIQAIVINSSTPESEVRGDIKGVKIIYSQRRVGNGYKSGLPDNKHKRGCQCIAGHYTCGESQSFVANDIPSAFSKKISGFSGKYAATILAVPQIHMGPKTYKKIEAYNAKIRKMKNACTKNQKLTPDELFK